MRFLILAVARAHLQIGKPMISHSSITGRKMTIYYLHPMSYEIAKAHIASLPNALMPNKQEMQARTLLTRTLMLMN